ncbi:hypothetical protein BGZ63DRAFT_174807 [Mariannaea sp. PMI_226]|nr:hypothetical protein BGZ63DRAFT_174807 [Mariannaea sp. PMI_226]
MTICPRLGFLWRGGQSSKTSSAKAEGAPSERAVSSRAAGQQDSRTAGQQDSRDGGRTRIHTHTQTHLTARLVGGTHTHNTWYIRSEGDLNTPK